MRIFKICIGFLFLIGCTSDQKQKITDTSVSDNDTLVFYAESSEVDYQQLLKVVYTSDSTIWYSLDFINQSGNKKIVGEGVDIYYNLDPEIDEVNGEAQPVFEFESLIDQQEIYIRIDMLASNFAKVITTPNYTVQEKPLDVVLMKR